MDTQAIKTFIQVANLGSFTRAAEELRSLLEVLLIIVCTICIRFLYMHPEKVFQSVDCVSTETCVCSVHKIQDMIFCKW